PQQLQHFPQTISRPEYNENLWSNPITSVLRTILTLSNYVESLVKMEDIVFEGENICNLDIA
ncbi:30477_t:CDS:1, partial [Gigaspora margarita]